MNCIKLLQIFLFSQDKFLQALSEIRTINSMYSIHSIFTARNFGILNFHLLNTTISLFKIANCVQIQYFTFEQVRKLFCEFVHGHHTLIEDAVILIDGPNWMGAFSICLIVLWELKVFHSYPALVCLCECIISQNWQLLHKSNLGSISYWKSQQFPENKLYNNSDISGYNTLAFISIYLKLPML